MNKSRELFLLFPYVGQKVEGYTIIHKHTSLNDEPPYKMCSFFGKSSSYDLTKENFDDDYYQFYLIRSNSADNFINWMNQTEKDYLDGYYQLQVERSYDDSSEQESQLSNNQIEEIVSSERSKRRPKVKYMTVQPQLGNFNIYNHNTYTL
jgi:hypothetical protein